jgi:hypothetical protein
MKGEMECWSTGVLGFKCITPLLHHSSIAFIVMME